jgi:SAM-dependent methyltransferase
VYTTPEPSPDAIDPTLDLHTQSFYRLPADLKVRWIRRSRPVGSLLEVGCGDGYFLEAAMQAGYDVAGVEPHPQRAQYTEQRLGIRVERALLEDVDWQGARFDIVYHCDLLSHFPSPVEALRKMATLLQPGGVLAFEVGTLAEISEPWYQWIGSLGYPHHRWLYSERSLARLLDHAGLRIEKVRHFGLAPSVILGVAAHWSWKLLHVVNPGHQRSMAVEARPERPAALDRAYERYAMFVRYRIGAFSPRIGPGTLFVVARPI